MGPFPILMEMTHELRAKLEEHVGTHVEFPASCNDVVMACNNLSEFSAHEKEWFSGALPHGSFENANDIKRALKL